MSHETSTNSSKDKNILLRLSQSWSVHARTLSLQAVIRFKRLITDIVSQSRAVNNWRSKELSPLSKDVLLIFIGIGANALYSGYTTSARLLINICILLAVCRAVFRALMHEEVKTGIIICILLIWAGSLSMTEVLIKQVESNNQAKHIIQDSNSIAQLQPEPSSSPQPITIITTQVLVPTPSTSSLKTPLRRPLKTSVQLSKAAPRQDSRDKAWQALDYEKP